MIQIFSSKRAARKARRNPDGLVAEGGRTLLATAVGVGGALALEAGMNGMKKGGTGADANLAKYSDNTTAAVVGGVGLVVGVALHARDTAPRVGKALIAASLALATSRVIAHRKDTEAQRAGRLAGSRGIVVRPVPAAGRTQGAGAYGYLTPSGAAVGPQYGEVRNDGMVVEDPNVAPGPVVGPQYGDVAR